MAASSGIGTTAIQLAKAFGAFVVATAGSDEKCEASKRLGADAAINYKTADFVEAVKKATRGHVADVILDMVGGDYLGAQSLTPRRRTGASCRSRRSPAHETTIDLRQIMLKRLTLTGSTLRNRPLRLQGRARARARGDGLADDRAGPLQAGHRQDFPARGGGRGAPAHRQRRAHRQDHPDRSGLMPIARSESLLHRAGMRIDLDEVKRCHLAAVGRIHDHGCAEDPGLRGFDIDDTLCDHPGVDG